MWTHWKTKKKRSSTPPPSKTDLTGASEKLIVEIIKRGDLQLQEQLKVWLAKDQRALGLFRTLLTLSMALAAACFASQLDSAFRAAAAGMLFPLLIATWHLSEVIRAGTAKFAGQWPHSFETDVQEERNGKKFEEVMAEEAENIQICLSYNFERMWAAGDKYEAAVQAASYSPAAGLTSGFLCWFYSSLLPA